MADHTISIDVVAKSLQETVSLLKQLREDVKSLNRTSINIDVKANVKDVTQSINNLRREMSQFASLGAEMNTANIEFFDQKIQDVIDKLGEANSLRVEPDIESESIEQAASRAERLAAGLSAAAGVAGSLSGVFSALGDFGGMFADSFGAMSGMFKFDAVGTASRYLTAMATKAVTGQINGIIERYDIMNTFVPYMELAGVDQSTAQASLNAVDQSIRGIPIGLDEAAFRLRKYQMYMNDIDRATNFTIGIQKAITAGGASEQMKTTAYTQIDRLLATGKLGQSRQWLSLFNGLGVSLRFLREELALEPTADLKTIAADLANGTIATDDFLRAIERLADNEGLDQALEIYKGTIEAWRSNIDNAIKRGGQSIMESVNSVLEDTYGQGITGFMKNVRDGIDTISKDASAYIEDNPQHVQTLGTAISGLLDRVMTLDGGRFVTNLVNNGAGLAGAIGTVFDSIPPGFLEDFTAFATTWAGPMATVMTAAQSGIGVVFGVFDRMKDFDMPDLLGKITGQIEDMAGAVSVLLGLIPDGLLGDLMAFGLVWGKPLASVFGSISSALKNMAGALGDGVKFSETSGIFGQLTWLVANHPLVMGSIAAIAGAIGAVYKLNQEYKEWQQGVLDEQGYTALIDNIDQVVEKSTTLKDSLETSTDAYRKEVDGIRRNAEDAQELLKTILETNDEIDKRIQEGLDYDDLYDSQIENIEKLKAVMPELSGLLGLNTEGLLENAAALSAQGDAYIELVKKQAEAEAMREQLTSAYAAKWEADANRRDLEQQQRDLIQSYKDSRAIINELTGEDAFATLSPEEMEKYVAAGQIVGDYEENMAKIWEGFEENAKAAGIAQEQIDYLAQKLGILDREANQIVEDGSTEQAQSIIEGTGESADKASNSVEELAQRFQELKEEAETSLRAAVEGFEKLEEAQTVGIDVSTGNVEGQNKELTAYRDNLTSLIDIIGQMTPEQLENAFPTLQRIAEGGFEDRGVLAGIVQGWLNGGEEGLINAVNLQEALFGETGSLEAMLAQILEETGQNLGEMDNEEFSGVADSIRQVFLDSIAGLQEDFAADGEVGEQMQTLTDQLFKPFETKIYGDESGEGGLVTMMGEAGQAVQEGMSQIAESTSSAIEPVTSAFDDASSAADDFKSSVIQAGMSAVMQAGPMFALSGSLNSVASSAANAFSNVSALAAAINRLQDKTINIRVNISAGLGRLAKGGMAGYFASGGNVLEGFPGMGSGSDIIPAWLTPGEYVMRRSAVGMFGSRFMDRVNKMDIGGAFDALMSRISNPMHMGGNTYNRDNHATVNNYFYGDNGQNYSQRKAYRYAGSL